jgi:hypothetical protein
MVVKEEMEELNINVRKGEVVFSYEFLADGGVRRRIVAVNAAQG